MRKKQGKERRLMAIKPLQFLREVRMEGRKVTWLNRKETIATTTVVFVMIFLMAMFLLLCDWAASSAIQFILSN